MARIDAAKKGLDIETVFQDRLGQVAQDTEALLDRLLAPPPVEGERARPARLLDAMRYVGLGGGKRLRPFLVVESAALFDVSRQNSLMAGAALECVHCYSLAHDDLPAMDNDDLRRGRPTAHKAFDEATAILAGDGLLTFAFDILCRPETHSDAEVRLKLVSALARAAGLGGMVGGQMLDLAAEGRSDASPPRLGEQEVKVLQAMKTGALLRFGCLAGAILGKAEQSQWQALERYGSALGEAFLISLTSKVTRRRWANPPARMPPPIRRHWSECSGPQPRGAGSRAWSPRPSRRSAPSAAMPTCSRRRPSSSQHVRPERRAGHRMRPRAVQPLGTAGWTRTTDLLVHSQAL